MESVTFSKLNFIEGSIKYTKLHHKYTKYINLRNWIIYTLTLTIKR